MGLLDLPDTDNVWIKRYSLFLKFEGQVFGGIIIVAYFLKWGVAWHDAVEPSIASSVCSSTPSLDMPSGRRAGRSRSKCS